MREPTERLRDMLEAIAAIERHLHTTSASMSKYPCTSTFRIPMILDHSISGAERTHILGQAPRRLADDLQVPDEPALQQLVVFEGGLAAGQPPTPAVDVRRLSFESVPQAG